MMKEFDGEPYYSRIEIAKMRKVSPVTVDYWRKELGLKSRRVGGRWFFSLAVFAEWEASRQ